MAQMTRRKLARLGPLAAIATLLATATTTSNALALAKLPSTTTWNASPYYGTVPVCWRLNHPTYPFTHEMAVLQDAIERSWVASAAIRVNWQGICPASPSGTVVIKLSLQPDYGGSTHGSGTQTIYPNGSTESVWINISDFTTNDNWLRYLGTHEFGHVLGFMHEQDRTENFAPNDQDLACTQGTSTVDVSLSSYDHDSIMNYCSPRTTTTGAPSAGDVAGAAYSYGARWQSAGIVGGSAQSRDLTTMVATNSDVFGVEAQNGNIYRLQGSTWTQVGGPGRAFATNDASLYALDLNGIPRQWVGGTSWVAFGGAAGSLYAGRNIVVASDPYSGDLYKYENSSWARIGGPARTVAINATDIYAVDPDGHTVRAYAGGSWTVIGIDSQALIARGTSLYSINLYNGSIWKYTGSGTYWSPVGGAGAQFTISTSGGLFALSTDRTSVFKYSGTGSVWNFVGNGGGKIAATNSLYASASGANSVYKLISEL